MSEDPTSGAEASDAEQEPQPEGAPAEPLPAALRRAARRVVGVLLMAGLVMAALAFEGHSVLPALVPLLTWGFCLVVLATVARPSPATAPRIALQLLALGCLAPLCALLVIAQYHYAAAILAGQTPDAGWRSTFEQLGYLVRLPLRGQDLAFVFAVATAAAIATYAFAPGRRHLRALLIAPVPSVATLIAVRLAQPDTELGYRPSFSADLGLFALGVFTLTLAWSIVFLVSERGGPGPASLASNEVSESPPDPDQI